MDVTEESVRGKERRGALERAGAGGGTLDRARGGKPDDEEAMSGGGVPGKSQGSCFMPSW